MQSDRRIVSFLSLEKKDTRRVLNGMEHLQINIKKKQKKMTQNELRYQYLNK